MIGMVSSLSFDITHYYYFMPIFLKIVSALLTSIYETQPLPKNVVMLLAPSKTPLEDTKQRYQKLIDYIDGKFKAQQGIEVIQFSLSQNPEAIKVPQAIRYFLCYQADEQRGLTGISYWTPMRKKLTKKGSFSFFFFHLSTASFPNNYKNKRCEDLFGDSPFIECWGSKRQK